MPTRRPPWEWHQNRDNTFDRFIGALLSERGYDVEREYHGITTLTRAKEVRQKMRTSGRHFGVSVKAYWRECSGCPNGGDDCRFHVRFSVYDPDKAREYMARKIQAGRGK